ncbi:MAG: replication initiator protein A [Candidatus Bathyarchaeota archaeon]|nr:replication initiator protein A [Candidatus Termitimicrobium sp.]
MLNSEFKSLSNDAKVLYMLLRDRHDLSVKNGWYDDKDRVFLYFKRENMQDILGLSRNTVTKAMQALKDYGLAEEVRQGLNKPNRIYLLNPAPPLDKTEATKSGSHPQNPDEQRKVKFSTSGGSNFEPLESQILTPINTEYINTECEESLVMSSQSNQTTEPKKLKPDRQDKDKTHTTQAYNHHRVLPPQPRALVKTNDPPPAANTSEHGDRFEKRLEIYEKEIKDNISYNDLKQAYHFDVGLIDDFVTVVLDTVMTRSDNEPIRINGENKPRALVSGQLMRLTYEDIEHCLKQFKNVTERITKKKQYILTMLYNCKMERNSHERNRFIWDIT